MPLFRVCFFRAAVLLALLAAGACSSPKNSEPVRAFYYWKTTFNISPPEQQRLQALKVKKLYLRLFDVDLDADGLPVPVAPVIIPETPQLPGVEIVPVIFITNRTMQALAEQQVPELAQKISKKVQQLMHKAGRAQVQEIQLDCDWSETSRVRYFSLIEALKYTFPEGQIRISATIRLHQVKYAERTGIPPADRGMLMFYNMGNLSDTSTVNSIYNSATASQYLSGFEEYALPLDLALPVFTWGVLQRKGQVKALMHNLYPADLESAAHFRHTGSQRYTVLRDTIVLGNLLRPGDRLRLEETTPALAREAANLIAPVLQKRDQKFTVSLFHWDPKSLTRYDNQDLEALYRSVQ